MKIYQFENTADTKPLEGLLREYLAWAGENVQRAYGLIVEDSMIEGMIANDLKSIDKFMPPSGRLLLGEIEQELAGMAFLRKMEGNIGEIKRMYVRPQFRKLGLARKLLQALVSEAKTINCSILRLDSARFMTNAHQLYRSVGFKEIDPYEGSEVPDDIRQYWVFMELSLANI